MYTCTHTVQVQDIRRANNLWASESIQSRLVVKIPLSSGESVSHSHSPKISRSINNDQSEQLSSKGHLPTIVASNGAAHNRFDEHDEVVRSKPGRRCQTSSPRINTDGVKTIADILNSADEQLKLSQEFSDRLAIRRSVFSAVL